MSQDYRFVARNEHGDWCGHWHRRFIRASRCARSWERYTRRKYGKRETWAIETLHAEGEQIVARKQAAAIETDRARALGLA